MMVTICLVLITHQFIQVRTSTFQIQRMSVQIVVPEKHFGKVIYEFIQIFRIYYVYICVYRTQISFLDGTLLVFLLVFIYQLLNTTNNYLWKYINIQVFIQLCVFSLFFLLNEVCILHQYTKICFSIRGTHCIEDKII